MRPFEFPDSSICKASNWHHSLSMKESCAGPDCRFPQWMKMTLVAAGIYNLIFGLWAVCWPHLWFDWSGMARPEYSQIWQSVGMQQHGEIRN